MKLLNERIPAGSDAVRCKRGAFTKTTLLLGTLAAAGCAPDINIRNIPYDPNSADAGCSVKASCAIQTLTLRESGSGAGSSEASVGGATISFVGLKDSGSTKVAQLRMKGCGYTADADFLPGASSVLGLGNESFSVKLESMEYDTAGIVLKVLATPVCGADGGKKADGGAGAEDGAQNQ